MDRPSEIPVAPRALLFVIAGGQEGARIPLLHEESILGRSPRAEVTLSDEGVSREHACLSYDRTAGGWTLEDLQSTNGTRVNGKRIRSCALHPGDEIQIGNVRLRLVLGD
ncbi:Glycogen accumulation regulator GarA [Myxococcaceae bacterium]|jgi:pSer/pThr/pTyr-binding forkhead associated (FHA) protein|nr:Glycogen accumulation regulator GarA [Myxococcaceae bacterium]